VKKGGKKMGVVEKSCGKISGGEAMNKIEALLERIAA
jgi:hypothetical protein